MPLKNVLVDKPVFYPYEDQNQNLATILQAKLLSTNEVEVMLTDDIHNFIERRGYRFFWKFDTPY